MPKKSVKRSDDEGVIRVEETEVALDLTGEESEPASTNGKVEHNANDQSAEPGAKPASETSPVPGDAASVSSPAATEAAAPVAETSSREESSPEVGSAQNEAEEQGGASMFPLEIEHGIEVTPDEAMAAGWPGVASVEEEPASASAFPLEIDPPGGCANPIMGGDTKLIHQPDTEEVLGAVELDAQERKPVGQEATAIADSAEHVPHAESLPKQDQAEPPGAVELPARDALPAEQGSAEIIGPLELAQFFTESAADPASIVGQTPTAVVEAPTTATQGSERKHLVKSAALVSIGNLGSSLLGMVRQIVVTAQGNAIAAPFNAALAPVNNFYQLLVNGSTDGALIPVFNDYAAPERRHEMRRVVFTVVNLILIIAVIASVGYLLISPWFVDVIVSGYKGPDKTLTLQYSQVIFFSLVVLGPFAVLLAALFSLKTFGWPAFATASYHAGIILGALAFALVGDHFWGPVMLPIGLLIGATGQIALLLPGIRSRKLYYMFVLDLKHPALKRIYRLYWPIAVSYVFSMALVFLDLHLQSLTPQHAAATTAMATATTLIQFPIGLVAQALSVAVLPTLSEHAREGNTDRFKETLLLGFRLGLLLMIPAMTGLLVLRTPIVYVIFAHHNYGLGDANLSALALQNYAYQLPFVAMDQLLIAAFYARKNTKTPVIIGVVSMLFYLAVALPFYGTIGVAALAFANTVQNTSHAIILLILLRMSIGSLHIRRTIPAILKICLAAVAMALVAWGAMTLLAHVSLFSLDHLIGQLLTVIVAGGLAVAVYVGGILLLKVEEINLVKRAVLAKLGKK